MSYLDKRGRWQGFFVDYCRALAAAVLGDANKVKFMPVASSIFMPRGEGWLAVTGNAFDVAFGRIASVLSTFP